MEKHRTCACMYILQSAKQVNIERNISKSDLITQTVTKESDLITQTVTKACMRHKSYNVIPKAVAR